MKERQRKRVSLMMGKRGVEKWSLLATVFWVGAAKKSVAEIGREGQSKCTREGKEKRGRDMLSFIYFRRKRTDQQERAGPVMR